MMDTVGVVIKGTDELSGPAQHGAQALGGIARAANQASSPLGSLGRMGHAAAGGLAHAGGQIRNLIAGPLGLIGLTGGLFGVAGALESSLHRINDLAFGTEKLTAITGDSAEQMSTLVAVSEKYGIDLEKLTTVSQFYEKAVGKLEQTQQKGAAATKSAALAHLELRKAELEAEGRSTKRINLLIREQKARDQIVAAQTKGADGLSKLEALEKQYNVVLTDSTGKALSFVPALLNVADVYARSTDKAKAAALAATLFGKSYGTLAPILALGKQGIIELQAQAASMGLQLSADNIAQFKEYRDAVRESQEAIAGLQVAIGTDLLPTIIKAANGITGFISVHKTDIVHTIDGLIAVASTAAGTIGNVAGAVAKAWSAIPEPARNLLIAAVAGDRTLHWLFGFSPIHLIVSGIENAFSTAVSKGLGGALGQTLLGGVQKVWVVNPGFGVGGGLAGAGETAAADAGGLLGIAGRAGGIAGALKTGLALGIAGLAVGMAAAIQQQESQQSTDTANTIQKSLDASLASKPSVADLQTKLGALNDGIDKISSNPLFVLVQGDALDHLKAMRTQVENEMAARREEIAAIKEGDDQITGALGRSAAKAAHPDWLKAWERLVFHTPLRKGLAGAAADLAVGHNIASAAGILGAGVGMGGKGGGGVAFAEAEISALKAALVGASAPERAAIVGALTKIEARLPRLRDNLRNVEAAEKIALSTESVPDKLKDLNAILTDVKRHGDVTTQHKIEALISAVKAQKLSVVVPITVFPTAGGGTRTVRASRSIGGTTYAGHAGGGPVMGDEPVWVGEAGRELFMPERAGTVIPRGLSDRLAAGGVGGGIPHELLARLLAVLEQLARGVPRQELEAKVSARDVSAMAARRSFYGDDRARQMGY